MRVVFVAWWEAFIQLGWKARTHIFMISLDRIFERNSRELFQTRGRRKTTPHLCSTHSNLNSKIIPIAMPILPIWDCQWTLSSAPFPVFVGSGTTSIEVDDGGGIVSVIVSVICGVVAGDVTVSVLDAVGEESVRDVVLLIVVGGKVRGGRLLQRELKSEVPNYEVSHWQVLENWNLMGAPLAFTILFQYTDQGWFYWDSTICALLDFRVTSRSAETRYSGARIIQRCCRGTYTCTLIKGVTGKPTMAQKLRKLWTHLVWDLKASNTEALN